MTAVIFRPESPSITFVGKTQITTCILLSLRSCSCHSTIVDGKDDVFARLGINWMNERATRSSCREEQFRGNNTAEASRDSISLQGTGVKPESALILFVNMARRANLMGARQR